MPTLISHFYNEEFLLPYWVRHHLPLFDRAVLIDYDSTDRSVEIVRELAPHWEVRPTDRADFDAHHLDHQVQSIEREFEGWKMALNVTEFLMAPDLPERLSRYESEGIGCVGITSVIMVDRPEDRPVSVDPNVPLYLQCRYGYFDPGPVRRGRWLHCHPDGCYELGRHGTRHVSQHDPEILICWFGFAPFDLAKPRKLQIKTKMSEHDKQRGLGFQHLRSEEEMEAVYRGEAAASYDLWSRPEYLNLVRGMARLHGVEDVLPQP